MTQSMVKLIAARMKSPKWGGIGWAPSVSFKAMKKLKNSVSKKKMQNGMARADTDKKIIKKFMSAKKNAGWDGMPRADADKKH